nr:BUD13 [Hymenolepis microstoma]
MSKAQVSKEEYLKKYLKPKCSGKKSDGQVHYITGEMPDTLDAYEEVTKAQISKRPLLNFDEDDVISPLVEETQVRKRTKGIPSEEDLQNQLEKARKKAELEAKYQLWNRGIDTIREEEQKLQDAQYEASKPLARYADDQDLNSQLKNFIHAEDPMSAYFAEKAIKKRKKEEKKKKKKEKRKKKSKKKHGSEEESNADEEIDDRPRYKGPTQPPSNRFDIWPGYRWDGVDRSNGFEKKYMEEIARKKVEREEFYKWSVEDM